jgi:hypothetical protein
MRLKTAMLRYKNSYENVEKTGNVTRGLHTNDYTVVIVKVSPRYTSVCSYSTLEYTVVIVTGLQHVVRWL